MHARTAGAINLLHRIRDLKMYVELKRRYTGHLLLLIVCVCVCYENHCL